jgi:hypothetical protein
MAPVIHLALVVVLAALATPLVLSLAGCPQPSVAVEPTYGPQGVQTQVLELTGTDTSWAPGDTTVSFPDAPGITVLSEAFPSATSGRVVIAIDPSVPAGETTLRVETVLDGQGTGGQGPGGGETEVAEAVFEVLPGPELIPARVERGEPNQAAVLRLDERHYQMGGFQLVSEVPGVDVAWLYPLGLQGDTRELEVGFDVGLEAQAGMYPGGLVVRTVRPAAGGHPAVNQDVRLDLEVTPVQGRYLELYPVEAEQGSTVALALIGHKTVFSATSVDTLEFDPGEGIEVVGTPVVASATRMEAELLVYSDAPPGVRAVRVQDLYGELLADFEVLADPTPPSMVLVPDSAPLRWDQAVTVAGTNTHFEGDPMLGPVSQVTVEPAGQGLEFTIDSVLSPFEIRLQSAIDIDTPPGDYRIWVTTGAERVGAWFTVEDLPPASITVAPDTARQGDTVALQIAGTDTHFDLAEGTALRVVDPPGSGVTVSGLQVDGHTLARATLEIAEDALVGPVTLQMDTPGYNEAPEATFTVQAGIPEATLFPDRVEQGEQGVTVQATGRFTHWVAGQTAVEIPDCSLDVQQVQVSTEEALSFELSVPLFHAVTTCTVRISSPQETVEATLEVTPGYYEPPTIPHVFTDELTGGPERYLLSLAEGDVLRVRVRRMVWETLDPEIAIYPVGATQSDPLAENDDESAATVSARIVFQAPETAMYFLQVRDHWGMDQGYYEVDLAWYQHQGGPSALEVDPITDPDANDEPAGTQSQAQAIGPVGSGWCLRAGFQGDGSPPVPPAPPADDESDWFVLPSPPGPPGSVDGYRLAVAVLARDLSPFSASTPAVTLRVHDDPAATPIAEAVLGTAGQDPVVYLPAILSGTDPLYVQVQRDPASPAHVTYWLNLRPWLVINELRLWPDPAAATQADAYHGAFVELFGEPQPGTGAGLSLAGCELQLLVDGALHQALALDGRSLTEWGYHVVAHDDSVPGVGAAQAEPTLAFPLGSTGHHAVQLWCDGALLDAVQLNGTLPQGGEGDPLAPPTSPDTALGRGFHLDTGDNRRDFLEQIEPSPWAPNLSEVN